MELANASEDKNVSKFRAPRCLGKKNGGVEIAGYKENI